jgi:hypothetical protein
VRIDNVWGESHEQFLEHLNGNVIDVHFTEMELKPWLQAKDLALEAKARNVYTWHLRRLVNTWIATGRDGQREDPLERHVNHGLMRILSVWAAGNPVDYSFDRSGETILSMPLMVGLPRANPSPFFCAYEAAVRRFARFLDTQEKYQLCECRSCGAYYYLRRMVRGPLEHGTYCSAHRQIASAQRSNKRKLDPILERRIRAAAIAMAKLPKRLQGWRERAEWIRDQVNKHRLKFEDPVKLTWVTRRLADIEKAAKELNLATR